MASWKIADLYNSHTLSILTVNTLFFGFGVFSAVFSMLSWRPGQVQIDPTSFFVEKGDKAPSNFIMKGNIAPKLYDNHRKESVPYYNITT